MASLLTDAFSQLLYIVWVIIVYHNSSNLMLHIHYYIYTRAYTYWIQIKTSDDDMKHFTIHQNMEFYYIQACLYLNRL